MKRSILGFMFSLALLSCSNNEPSVALSYSEIGASETEKPKTEPQIESKKDSIQINFDAEHFLLCGGFEVSTMHPILSNEVLDRGQHSEKEKYYILGSKDSVSIKAYSFSDTATRKNSFYNLLDCFDETCQSIGLLDTNFQSNKYHLLLVSDFSIDWISSNKNQDRKVWMKYFEKTRLNTKYLYIFEQLKNEQIQWL